VDNSFEALLEYIASSVFSLSFLRPHSEIREHQRKGSHFYKALAFVEAHIAAGEALQCQLSTADSTGLSEAEKLVLGENEVEIRKASKVLEEVPRAYYEGAVSHIVSAIALNQQGEKIRELLEQGILKDDEAAVFFQEIKHDLDHISLCARKLHFND